jgi:hypothetical protein
MEWAKKSSSSTAALQHCWKKSTKDGEIKKTGRKVLNWPKKFKKETSLNKKALYGFGND